MKHSLTSLGIVERARLRSLVVGGNPGSRAVVFPIPRVGLLDERPAEGERRRNEKSCNVKWRMTQLCTFRVIDKGKSEARLPSRAHVQMERHPEFHLDCALMGRATEDRESWMCGFSKGQWLIARDKEYENSQRCVNVWSSDLSQVFRM